MRTDRKTWLESNGVLARIMRGEHVPDSELPDNPDPVKCAKCKDTRYIVSEGLYGQATARRCELCRERTDAEDRAKSGSSAGVEVPDDPPPRQREFRRLAGLDGDDED